MEAACAQMLQPGGAGEPDLGFQFAADFLRQAEGYGFNITLLAERFFGPDHEAWMMSAALAPLTTTMRLMPAIHPGMITPQVVAKMAATLDRMSSGRCALNIVNGWWPQEFNMYSNGAWLDDETARYRRMNEFIQVLKGLWRHDEFSYDGEFYQLDAGTLPNKPATLPYPPLYAASRADAGKEIVARECDVWFAVVQPNYRNYDENARIIIDGIAGMKARAANYGRELGYGISCHVICNENSDVVAEAAGGLEREGQMNRLAGVAAKAMGAGLVGAPQLVADRIKRYEDAGITTLLLHFHPMLDGLDTFAEKVIPLLGSSAPKIATEPAKAPALH